MPGRRWRIVVAGLAVGVLLPLGLTLGSAYLSPRCAALAPAEPYDVAVVLSAGLRNAEVDSRPGMTSAFRTRAGVDLYRRDVVSRLLVTGHASPYPEVAVARGMRDLAIAEGVPANAITVEDRSQSTLQNALFSAPLLGDDDRVLLVSSGYHLWRGALSMRWAGVPVAGTCKSYSFDPVPFRGRAEVVLASIPKWWGNLGRATAWSVASGIGLQDRLPPWFLD